MPPISLLIIGAGNRCAGYATAALLQPEWVRVEAYGVIIVQLHAKRNAIG